MNNNLIVLGFIISLYGCRIDAEYSEKIDYDELSLIDVTIEMEIGESPEYLPGELHDLVVFSDKTILVADWGNKTIEQFNAEGEHIATIAKEGRGPGELPELFSLVKGVNDTLMVDYFGMSQKVDFFSRGENNIYRYVKSWVPDRFKERTMNTIAPHSETKFYAREIWNNQQFRSMAAEGLDYEWVPVAIVDAYQNIFVDSLHLLKTPNPVARVSQEGAMTILGWPPYQYSDQFMVLDNNRYVVARPDSSELFIYNNKHEFERSIILNVKDRPIEKSDLDFNFESNNVTDDGQKELEARIPDIKPVFLNIWASEEYFGLHVDTNEEGMQIVILTMEGEFLGTFYLSVYDDIQYFKNDTIYTLHKDPQVGHTIRIYRIRL